MLIIIIATSKKIHKNKKIKISILFSTMVCGTISPFRFLETKKRKNVFKTVKS